MKIIYALLLVSPLGLNAMVPDVTKWQEICKDPQEKQKLVTVYKDFCKQRLHNAIPWTVASWVPVAGLVSFALKKAHYHQSYPGRIFGGSLALISLFAARQTFILGKYSLRNDYAAQGNLYYLNHDILKQLGNPDVEDNPYFDVEYTDSYLKDMFGFGERHSECLSVDNIAGIERALSEKYKWRPTWYPDFSTPEVQLKNKIKSLKQRIKDTIQ